MSLALSRMPFCNETCNICCLQWKSSTWSSYSPSFFFLFSLIKKKKLAEKLTWVLVSQSLEPSLLLPQVHLSRRPCSAPLVQLCFHKFSFLTPPRNQCYCWWHRSVIIQYKRRRDQSLGKFSLCFHWNWRTQPLCVLHIIPRPPNPNGEWSGSVHFLYLRPCGIRAFMAD